MVEQGKLRQFDVDSRSCVVKIARYRIGAKVVDLYRDASEYAKPKANSEDSGVIEP